jgi:hypothetical protein
MTEFPMLTRLLTFAHLTTLAVGIVESVRGESGVGTLLLCVGVLMLVLLRVNEMVDQTG